MTMAMAMFIPDPDHDRAPVRNIPMDDLHIELRHYKDMITDHGCTNAEGVIAKAENGRRRLDDELLKNTYNAYTIQEQLKYAKASYSEAQKPYLSARAKLKTEEFFISEGDLEAEIQSTWTDVFHAENYAMTLANELAVLETIDTHFEPAFRREDDKITKSRSQFVRSINGVG